eukprot:c28335_g1_i1 orf=11-307(-)
MKASLLSLRVGSHGCSPKPCWNSTGAPLFLAQLFCYRPAPTLDHSSGLRGLIVLRCVQFEIDQHFRARTRKKNSWLSLIKHQISSGVKKGFALEPIFP